MTNVLLKKSSFIIVIELSKDSHIKIYGSKEEMDLIEDMVIKKLDKYKEVANRDRFILPIDNDIKLFTDIIDNCVNFFN